VSTIEELIERRRPVLEELIEKAGEAPKSDFNNNPDWADSVAWPNGGR
jgi:hypothetical protein